MQADNREQIDQIRAGDPLAWKSLVGTYLSTVHAICRAFGLDQVAASDVNQAVWLRLVERLPRIQSPDAIGGWIAATTRRECLDPARHGQRSAWIAGGLSVHLGNGSDAVHVAEGIALGRSFARLGAAAQRVLRLSAAFPQPSDDVIAAALNLPAADVPAARARARARLDHLVAIDGVGNTPANVQLALERVLAAGDSVPSTWWSAADAAFGWLCIDAEVAETIYDSTLGVNAPQGGPLSALRPLRGRSLRFSAGPRQVDVIIDVAGDGGQAEVVLRGRVNPAERHDVVARWPGGSLPVAVGPDGVFHLSDLPLGPLCVEVEVDGDAAGRTGDDEDSGQPLAGFKTGWIFP